MLLTTHRLAAEIAATGVYGFRGRAAGAGCSTAAHPSIRQQALNYTEP
ncbi:hypothetical protein BZL30_4502 [Mycobacterium kansasii]|uniref:Uncharacterized protein n=1 Tax=Mycobacterium kansasii TaxID=1768 RepID=A0A1V3X319_MYCKA|nr:hypothetical protein BZL29_8137 [Mycobacterium kansasii]OOK73589.1 hypothetical protein BZL30_4502 [Mycobacterium kansasii]